jgi:hypothetical protein
MCVKAVGKFLGNSDPFAKHFQNNDLVKVLAPLQTVGRRVGEGEKVSGTMLADPGAFASKTGKQKDAIAYAAAAPERAAAASLTDANNSLARLRGRRRMQGSTNTGAVGGSGDISTMLSYGKSTLG